MAGDKKREEEKKTGQKNEDRRRWSFKDTKKQVPELPAGNPLTQS